MKDDHQWTHTSPSTRSRAMEPETPTAATIVAVEDVAEVLQEVHQVDVEVTKVTMEMANQKEITSSKMVPNQPVGIVISTDIVKKIVARGSGRMLPTKASMAPTTGQNKKHHQWEKMKNNMKPKE